MWVKFSSRNPPAFSELDFSAAEAVKKWLFEPARRGKEAVQVWVLLPVKFELHYRN